MSVGRSAAVPRWVIILSRLDESREPLTAHWCLKLRPGQRVTDGARYLGPLEKHGLVERAHFGRVRKYRITEKGRTYLQEAMREISDFMRGEW